MTDLIETFNLSDRPDWWVPRLFKRLSLICLVISVISFFGLVVWGGILAFDILALPGESDFDILGYDFLSETLWTSLGILAYAVTFWLLSLAIDKIDQLVWLAASDTDRREIILKRTKVNNAKNQ